MPSRIHRWLSALICASVVAMAAPASGATLVIGSDISHPPLESFNATHQMIGFDIDLIQAIAARMGTQVRIENHDFGDLIPGVLSGRFSAALAGVFDTSKREKIVDLVDYMYAGSGLLVRRGNPKHIFSLQSLCGMTVDLEGGTLQEAEARAQSDACTKLGLGPINVLAFPTDSASLAAFQAGKSDAHIDDYPVIAYLARTLGGGSSYDIGGKPFRIVVYGIVVSKSNPALRTAIRTALLALIADGTYDKILRKWGLTLGALHTAPIDAGKLFEH
jgi:polar amino acid transport system substrate-binding protein